MKILKKMLSMLLTAAIMVGTICVGTVNAGAEKLCSYGVLVEDWTSMGMSLSYDIIFTDEERAIWTNPESYKKKCADGHTYGIRYDLLLEDGKNEYKMLFMRFGNDIFWWFYENGKNITNTLTVSGSSYGGWDYGIAFKIAADSPYVEKLKKCTKISGINAMCYCSNLQDCELVRVDGKSIKLDYAPVQYIVTEDISIPYKEAKTSITRAKLSDIPQKSYTGKAIKPDVTLKQYDFSTSTYYTLKKGKDYTVSYSDNKNIGSAVVTIKGIGDYTNTMNVNFSIVPAKTVLKAKKQSDTKVKLTWDKVKNAEKYQIYYSTNGGKYKKLATVSGSKTSYTNSKLDFKKNDYKFKIRAYDKVDGTTYYGSYSKAVTVK